MQRYSLNGKMIACEHGGWVQFNTAMSEALVLRRENERLQGGIRTLKDEKERLQGEVVFLHRNIVAQKVQITALEEENKSLRQTIEKLQLGQSTRGHDLTTQVKALQEEERQKNVILASLLAQKRALLPIGGLRGEIEQLLEGDTVLIAAQKREIAGLQSDANESAKRSNRLQQENERLRLDGRELNKQNDRLRRSLEIAQDIARPQSPELEFAKSPRETASSKVVAATNKLEASRFRVEELTDICNGLTKQVLDLQEKNKNLRQRNDGLRGVNKVLRQNQDLQKEDLQQEIGLLRLRREGNSARIKTLEKANQGLGDENERLLSVNAALRQNESARNVLLAENNASLQRRLGEASSKAIVAGNKVICLEEQLKNLSAVTKGLREENKKLLTGEAYKGWPNMLGQALETICANCTRTAWFTPTYPQVILAWTCTECGKKVETFPSPTGKDFCPRCNASLTEQMRTALDQIRIKPEPE